MSRTSYQLYKDGVKYSTPFAYKKSLDAGIAILQKFEPDAVFKVVVSELVIIDEYYVEKPRRCEDCDSLEHVEGSEFCKVSYPEGV